MFECKCSWVTEPHANWGQCQKSKNLKIAFCGSATNPGNDRTADKKWQRDLAAYAAARKQGIQPASTKRAAVDYAVKRSDQTGVAYAA